MLRPSFLALLLSTVALPALAEEQDGGASGNSSDDRDTIVVTAPRIITPTLSDVPVEREYDPDHVASYAVSTVGEVLDEIARENGDEEPSLLVNGEPVSGPEDIEDYPAEAIARVELLPRGSAARVGGGGGQRVYNIVLRDTVTTATATAGHRVATEGGWNSEQGELLLTHIRKQNRVNLTLRARDSGLLLESERDVIQPAPSIAFDPLGNVLPFPVGTIEVDPALSALVGTPVMAAGVPPGIANPTLAAFIPTANRVNISELGQFRSLRSANRGYEAGLAGSARVNGWLTASLNGKLDWNRDDGLSGLAGALFVVPAGPSSPFTRDVRLALSDASRPLASRGRSENANATFMLSARAGQWNPRLTARWQRQERTYLFERSGQSPLDPIVLAQGQEPFSPAIAGLIPVTADRTRTVTSGEGLRADIDGPLLSLPAGAIRVRAGAGIDWTRLAATRSSGTPSETSRSATTLQAGITVPLTSAREDVLPQLGDLEASADVVRVDFSDLAVLTNWSTELNWQFRPWIRFGAGFNRTRTAPDVELLSAPVVIYPNVRIFDPLREETVDVTAITGGNPGLRPQTVDVTRLSIGAAPLPKYNLQLQLDYTMSETRSLLGGLPPTSAAVMAAFPARYQRDATGRLITIDSRAINFERQDQDQLRYAATFTVPLYPRPSGEGAARALPAGPRPTIEFGASHTILLKNRILIAAGLPEIDLLREGASGIGGSRPRHLIEGGVSLSDRGTGVRLSGSWRSSSSLLAGTEFDPQRIRFGSLAVFDLRAFAETSRFFPDSDWAKGGRVSLVLQNFANTRQKVTDSTGGTPLSYQPAYRDPIGRTVMVELRKAF